MMGRSHLLLGAAGFLAIEAVLPKNLPSFIGPHLSAPELAAGTLVACGAALLPDLDHPQATLARCLPPVSKFVSHVVNTLAGGHRKGTHTIWAWALTSLLVYWALTLPSGPIVALGISIFTALLMLRVLTESEGLVCLLLAFVLGGAAVLAGGTDFIWIVHAVVIGFGLHLVGDIVTTEGIPILYPLPPNIAIPILGTTDKWRERSAGIICGLVAFVLLVITVFLPIWHSELTSASAATSNPSALTAVVGAPATSFSPSLIGKNIRLL